MPRLHFLSACTGFVIAGLLALTTSQASPPPATLNPASIRVEYMPHPRDMVQIAGDAPFTVPSGRIFVLTGLGTTKNSGSGSIQLTVNGQVELTAYGSGPSLHWPSVQDVPGGFSLPAGSVIAVLDQSGGGSATPFCRAWGYLASQ